MNTSERSPLKEAMAKLRSTFWSVGLFSCAVNLLMLTGPLFMLQVYDRVLASGSVPTLVALFGLVVVLFVFLGVFDLIRTKVLSRAGCRIDTELSGIANKAWIFAGLVPGLAKSRPLSDLGNIRQFLGSNGLPSLFDLPWVPIYLAVVYLLHVWLGLLATAGAVVVIGATILNELITRKPIKEASAFELRDMQFAEIANRNAESIIAMGMVGKLTDYWQSIRHMALANGQLAGARSEFIAAFNKSIRLLLQSGILALGAYLALLQEITPGTMIAASIIGGRALAPVDAAIANWRNFIRARQAYGRLSELLSRVGIEEQPLELPIPKGKVSVSGLVKMPPGGASGSLAGKPILQGLQFDLEPGDGLGVIGPSASGKSSLARLLVGLWMPEKGAVRLDGATFDQWDRDKVGKFVGYFPQNVELLTGTVRQNIARFDEDVSDEEIVAAAKLADVHELILNLPDGYSTDLAKGMQILSGGQVQRIGLARAVLRTPPLVVLDEPNSNLDTAGDEALTGAIHQLRQAGSCVVVMAHRPGAIAAVNKVLMLREGRQVEFGDRDEILAKVLQPVKSDQPSTKKPPGKRPGSRKPRKSA
ncbi:MAG: type I secretion system permease/ATPase [Pseudomonadota bacterium]